MVLTLSDRPISALPDFAQAEFPISATQIGAAIRANVILQPKKASAADTSISRKLLH